MQLPSQLHSQRQLQTCPACNSKIAKTQLGSSQHGKMQEGILIGSSQHRKMQEGILIGSSKLAWEDARRHLHGLKQETMQKGIFGSRKLLSIHMAQATHVFGSRMCLAQGGLDSSHVQRIFVASLLLAAYVYVCCIPPACCIFTFLYMMFVAPCATLGF